MPSTATFTATVAVSALAMNNAAVNDDRRLHTTDTAMNTKKSASLLFGTDEFRNSAGRYIGVDFTHCDIDVGRLREFFSDENKTKQFLELDFLNTLRAEDNAEAEFLPKAIFKRECMKLIFDLANNDTRGPCKGKRALIGSPGVGKSVLFFLVALIKACNTPVVYYRKTRNANDCSLFFMNVTKDKKVRIVFTRNFPVGNDSRTILNFLNMQQIDVNSYYTFVDGPKYTERKEIFSGFFDYFCTSGGYPLPKQEEQEHDRLWILDAWTKDEAIAASTQSSIFSTSNK